MVLVTGGAGFIGSHTVRALVEAGHRVRVLDDLSTGRAERLDGLDVELVAGSIEDAAAVAHTMEGVTSVLHLAARASVPASWAEPAATVRTNVEGFANVLHAAAQARVRRVVYASSCAVYGSRAPLPVPETHPVAPESPYAASKAADEVLASAWGAQGLSTLGLRYFNVFGPGQDPHGAYGAVIPTFVSRAQAGDVLRVDGDGLQGRDFISIADVVRANLLALRLDGPTGVVNVGSGERLTVMALAERVVRLTGSGSITRGPARVGDVRDSLADTSRARSALAFRATDPFDAALDRTLAWFADGADQRRLAKHAR